MPSFGRERHDPRSGSDGIQTVPGGVPVGIAPPEPEEDEEPAWVKGSYTVQTGWTFIEPDGTKTYKYSRDQMRSGSSFTLSVDEHFPDGAELRVSLDVFSELLFRGGNNQYVDVSHYGYYSIGSPRTPAGYGAPSSYGAWGGLGMR